MTALHPGLDEVARLAEKLAIEAPVCNINDFAARQAERFGAAIALDYFQLGEQLSYEALHRRSNRVAANLLALGYRKGTHIAVMLNHGPASALVWFAIQKIGAIIVPVNTAYQGKELDYILNQSDAQTLIIDEVFLSRLEDMKERPECLGDPHVVRREHLGALEVGGDLDVFDPGYTVAGTDLANLQYTSGTTGFPKGCMLTQNYWLKLAGIIGVNLQDHGCARMLIWAPFFYMDGQWTLLAAMEMGGTAVVASKMSLSKFLDWIGDNQIDYCMMPEPIMKLVEARPEDRDLPLKYIQTFGWRPSARAEAEVRFDAICRDAFGMTEVGLAMICPEASGEKLEQNICGVVAPGRETRVVDEAGRECAPGEPGELQIRGDAIMLGYYRRPEANQAAFDGDWFRSGDLFIKDAEGFHRIVGRLKDMIKRSGENISASEVEAAMRDAPQISEAAVIGVADDLRKEEVMVLVKRTEGVSPEEFGAAEVSAHSKILAAFKRPRYIGFVDEFPRTASNKIAKSRIAIEHIAGDVVDTLQEATVAEPRLKALLPAS
ncbi:acyl--CoA ligase [Rhodobacteraceae bacterium D3-12]|nr:acyl--CoA ligase [Rhodobacteraceae bacterium D3-12]